MNYEKVKAALMQGEEREAAKLFQELLRQSVRAGLFGAMAEEVEALCGPRYRPETLYSAVPMRRSTMAANQIMWVHSTML
ncbi:MAG: hypothetical protein JHC52_09205 [Chthoniobacterales bacterium]|nr:hypothetical protein [Chthoniobacterales bacterium]